jgi:hypothetical protein
MKGEFWCDLALTEKPSTHEFRKPAILLTDKVVGLD